MTNSPEMLEGVGSSPAPSKRSRRRPPRNTPADVPTLAPAALTTEDPTPGRGAEVNAPTPPVEARVVGTFFRWTDESGTHHARHGQTVTANPDVIERGRTLGLLA